MRRTHRLVGTRHGLAPGALGIERTIGSSIWPCPPSCPVAHGGPRNRLVPEPGHSPCRSLRCLPEPWIYTRVSADHLREVYAAAHPRALGVRQPAARRPRHDAVR